MSQKNTPKNKDFSKEMEKKVTPVLIMNNSALKPYIELFEYHPENIYQQPLGSLVGFFEIKDYSEDSAYIVNFLTSVLKKEYFINPKRPVTESLDSALHKVNVALSELIKHGNINWLGKIDGVVCVMEKNSIHFSVTGTGHIFIHRNQALTDISEDLAPDNSDPHPLKTFVNVSSGRIEKDDKILLFSDDIFHVLPTPQLKKNIQRFAEENFTQFLKTALGNELEMTAVIVIDVAAPQTKESKNVIVQKNPENKFNAFSEKTYTKKSPEAADVIIDIPNEEDAQQKNYTDKKTGHIYIQGEHASQGENSQVGLYMEIAKENIADGMFRAKNSLKRQATLTKKSLIQTLKLGKESLAQAIAKTKEKSAERASIRATEKQAREEAAAQEAEIKRLEAKERAVEERILAEKRVAEERVLAEQLMATESLEKAKIAKEAKVVKKQVLIKEIFENQEDPSLSVEKNLSFQDKLRLAREAAAVEITPIIDDENLGLQEKIERARSEMDQRFDRAMLVREDRKTESDMTNKLGDDAASEKESFIEIFTEKSGLLIKNLFSIIKGLLQKRESRDEVVTARSTAKQMFFRAIPNFPKINSLFGRLTKKQKMLVLATIFFIIFAPLAMGKIFTPKKAAPVAETPAPAPTLSQTLANDKNIALSTQTQNLLSQNGIIAVLPYDKIPYAIAAQKIIAIENGSSKEFPLPAESGAATSAAFMKDLSLIFVLTDQRKIISFSPISQQFKDNVIQLPEGFEPKFMATYLTYLYLPDTSKNQIYRYPRAEGGFGEKSDWLKSDISLTQIKDMTIDDSVYLSLDNKLVKLFKGQVQEMSFENSQTPLSFDKLYTDIDSASLYVLDTKNARLVQFNKTGEIMAQYFNENLSTAVSFMVDEQSKKAYIATTSGLISLAL